MSEDSSNLQDKLEKILDNQAKILRFEKILDSGVQSLIATQAASRTTMQLSELVAKVDAITAKVDALAKTQTILEAQLVQILALVAPPLPTQFVLTLTSNSPTEGEPPMAGKMKQAIDFQLLDNGTAKATLTTVDAAGEPAVIPSTSTLAAPAWSSSSPGLVITPAADGLSATIAPSVPPVLVTDAIITVGPATLTDASGNVTTIAGVSSEGIDVIAGGPSGFQISLS
jgi:hypothetical protein